MLRPWWTLGAEWDAATLGLGGRRPTSDSAWAQYTRSPRSPNSRVFGGSTSRHHERPDRRPSAHRPVLPCPPWTVDRAASPTWRRLPPVSRRRDQGLPSCHRQSPVSSRSGLRRAGHASVTLETGRQPSTAMPESPNRRLGRPGSEARGRPAFTSAGKGSNVGGGGVRWHRLLRGSVRSARFRAAGGPAGQDRPPRRRDHRSLRHPGPARATAEVVARHVQVVEMIGMETNRRRQARRARVLEGVDRTHAALHRERAELYGVEIDYHIESSSVWRVAEFLLTCVSGISPNTAEPSSPSCPISAASTAGGSTPSLPPMESSLPSATPTPGTPSRGKLHHQNTLAQPTYLRAGGCVCTVSESEGQATSRRRHDDPGSLQLPPLPAGASDCLLAVSSDGSWRHGKIWQSCSRP